MTTKDKEKKVQKTSNDPGLLASLGDVDRFNNSSAMTPVHPDSPDVQLMNGDKPIIFYYVGMESKLFQDSIYEGRNIKHQRMMTNQQYEPSWDDENELRNLSYCVTGWDNVPTAWFNGGQDMTPLLCPTNDPEKRALVHKLVHRLGWLRLQLQLKMWVREPFGKASSTN